MAAQEATYKRKTIVMLYNPYDDVALVIFFGILDADHTADQLQFINEVGSEARKTCR
jgi:hypothetical protein